MRISIIEIAQRLNEYRSIPQSAFDELQRNLQAVVDSATPDDAEG